MELYDLRKFPVLDGKEMLSSGAGEVVTSDAVGGGVFGSCWVPGCAECAAVLPAFAMEDVEVFELHAKLPHRIILEKVEKMLA